jgi:hypothetical protein
MKKKAASPSTRTSKRYEKPEVKSFSADELLEWIGPAQGIASGTGGVNTGGIEIDPLAVNKSPNKFGI